MNSPYEYFEERFVISGEMLTHFMPS